MNQSFDISTSNYHLPKISPNQSTYLRASNKIPLDLKRSASSYETGKNQKGNLTKKLVIMEDIKNMEEYQAMNDKELLREHEKLLKVLKKFQEIIEVNLQKKQKQREKKAKKQQTSKQQIFQGQFNNNKKIIENYSIQVKQFQQLKKCRKLNQILQQKSKVQGDINRLKKQLFNLKNQDNMAGRSLIADRGVIQKQLKEHEKDLKIELLKKQEYQQKFESLNIHLAELKKDCQKLNISDISNQKSNNDQVSNRIGMKKRELQEVTKNYVSYEDGIQENMVAKAKRNKNITKQIQASERKVVELNHKIQKYKQKISRYQQAMQIIPNKQ